MIIVDNLSKSYGKQVLFEDISFKVNPRERVGVVGRNGHGKTTLFRLIAGDEEPDSGMISKPRNYRIGCVEQRLRFKADSVFQEACRSLPPDSPNELWRAEKILFGLGFSGADLERRPAELSGGFQVRLNLAKVLLGDHQLLLLDEPNNYLDITSIRWLERFLLAWPGELMLITHDRSFMDKVVTHTLGIHRHKVRKIVGDTGKYYARIAQEEEVYEKTRVNDERKRKEMDLFITRFRAKARLAGLVQSRVKCLEKMEKKDRLETLKTLDFEFVGRPFHHKYAMSASGLAFGYEPGLPLFRDFTMHVGARDRVFIIGPNGKGKTTLLKVLAGVLKPQAGEVVSPQSVATGYFEQTNVSSLQDGNTVLDEIAMADPQGEPRRPRAIAGAMMFEGDDALKKIGILSGGEKSRVMLGKIIATPVNLLLLDEPTNHLDMESSDALLSAIDNFEGAVVMVTHDEMFLDALAERLVIFDGEEVFIYEGGYERFLERVGWRSEADRVPSASQAEAPKEREDRSRLTPKEMRRLRSEIVTEKSRALRPMENRMRELEEEVENFDLKLKELNSAIVRVSHAREGAKIIEISKSMHEVKTALDSRLEELEALTSAYEDKKAEFEKRLAALDEEDPGPA